MMSNKSIQESSQEILNIQKIVETIFQDIYDAGTKAEKCIKCNSVSVMLVDANNSIYKCENCKYSFSPRTNSLFQKVRFNNDKWFKMLTCMISDFTLEETVKVVQSNAESIQKKWFLIYEGVDWSHYNVNVRSKPTKNIYANFEVILS